MLERHHTTPPDSSARLFSTLLGIGVGSLVVVGMSGPVPAQLSNADRTDTATTATRSSTAVSASSQTAKESTSIEERVESRESGVNAAPDYARIAAECEKDARGVCKVTETDPENIVVYKQCVPPFISGNSTEVNIRPFGRYPECGIDQVATEAAREAARQEHRCLDRNGNWTTDRTQCSSNLSDEKIEELLGREIRDMTEREITDRVENTFIREKKELERGILERALQLAAKRVQRLLASTVYRFGETERTTLTANLAWFESQAEDIASVGLTRADLETTRNDLAKRLQAVQSMVTTQKRQLEATAPQLENIVTRIDYLVARVGTVLRDLERDGLTVPAKVTLGYEDAKAILTDAKLTCSMRRPASCARLNEVLDAIAGIREPLCELPSDRLSFCN
jgi:hypothetical protein